MELEEVRVSNFRSFAGTSIVNVSRGLNCIVGPNNTGKSNLLRAMALALQPPDPRDGSGDSRVFAEQDLPRLGQRPRSIKVRTTFVTDARPRTGKTSPDRRLLERALAYERVANPGLKPSQTYASRGRVSVNVEWRFKGDDVKRIEYLSVSGLGRATPLSKGRSDFPEAGDKEHDRFFTEFHKQIRFVSVRSGEALESVLSGPFREVLEGVIQDHLEHELGRAKAAREDYRTHLQTQLLGPLSERIAVTTGGIFPEMSGANLLPAVPTLQDTLSSLGVQLSDAVESDLSGKGTGVRAGVLIAILRYLSEQSKRSLVFTVEEPESFLHPAAQENLRDDLVGLAGQSATTVIITTHSPFLVPDANDDQARVISVSKNQYGISQLHQERDHRHTDSLFRDSGTAGLIRRAQTIPDDSEMVLIVEGRTDAEYLQLGARVAGRADLLDGIHFVPADGAVQVPAVAVVLAEATSKPVVSLLDSDEMGQRAARTLRGFNSRENRIVRTVGAAPLQPVATDGEDLWPAELRQRLEQAFEGEPRSVFKRGSVGWLEAEATPSDCNRVVATLEWIRKEAGLR